MYLDEKMINTWKCEILLGGLFKRWEPKKGKQNKNYNQNTEAIVYDIKIKIKNIRENTEK